MRVTHLGAVFGFERCRVEEHVCVDAAPEGAASLVAWIRTIVKCVHPEKGDLPSPPNTRQVELPDEAANTLGLQAKRSWLYDEHNIHLLNMPVTPVMVNAVTKGVPAGGAPHVTLLLQNQTTV